MKQMAGFGVNVLPNPYNRHIRYDLIFLTLISIIVQHSEGIPFGFYRSRTNVVSVGETKASLSYRIRSVPPCEKGSGLKFRLLLFSAAMFHKRPPPCEPEFYFDEIGLRFFFGVRTTPCSAR